MSTGKCVDFDASNVCQTRVEHKGADHYQWLGQECGILKKCHSNCKCKGTKASKWSVRETNKKCIDKSATIKCPKDENDLENTVKVKESKWYSMKTQYRGQRCMYNIHILCQ